jgi:hypothetical protein
MLHVSESNSVSFISVMFNRGVGVTVRFMLSGNRNGSKWIDQVGFVRRSWAIKGACDPSNTIDGRLAPSALTTSQLI